MPANLLLYPLDYPQEDRTNEVTIESAIDTVNIQARNTALKQAHTRRISGQNDIQNQNKLVRPSVSVMPLNAVGQVQIPLPAALGVAAYLAGGRGDGGMINSTVCFYYSNENAVPCGARLGEYRNYLGTVSTPAYGLYCGGMGQSGCSRRIEELNYARPSVSSWGSNLSQARHSVAGIGNLNLGLLLGGVAEGSSNSVRTGDCITYATKTNAPLGNALTVARAAPHNGTMNRIQGWIYGGSAKSHDWASLLFSVDTTNFSTLTTAATGHSLANAHLVHAALGASDKGILVGGYNATTQTSWFSTTATRFTYSGQTSAPIGSSLSEAKVCADGANNNLTGFVLGGDTANSNWAGTKTIDRLPFATEIFARVGNVLPQTMSDQGAISDYAASFN